ncbi:MAG TPA: phosphoribosylglycinamide formyltransferase [Chitinophagaceae bacterium]|nr:phosphoribosylglycinamide formyltransferase [Chitinophagaceae bacterium]
MFKGLRNKWKVNAIQLTLILFTFAIGGSLTGYAGRRLMNIFGIEQKWLWVIVYLLVIVILWPIAVLLVSILTGQFRFFLQYIIKMGIRMKLVPRRQAESDSYWVDSKKIKRLSTNDSPLTTYVAIFASGAGSNAQKIIEYFRNSKKVKVALIACNNPAAGVLTIAARENIPVLMIEKEKFFRGNAYVEDLKGKQIDFIVLAGFLWKLPPLLIKAYPGRIINIHPALLPNYGGKGMYGNKVHNAVLAAGEKESGITIHYVDDHYDNGDIIFQAKCPVLPGDTADSLAQRIHVLEHEHYPRIIAEVVGVLVSKTVS